MHHEAPYSIGRLVSETKSAPEFRNELLRRMSAEDLALLYPYLHRVTLANRAPLVTRGTPIDQIYFIERGIASVVARTPNGHQTETGFIGYEGMTGSAVVMDDDRSETCFMQIAGEAMCMDAVNFKAALLASPTLRLFLLRFVNYLQI